MFAKVLAKAFDRHRTGYGFVWELFPILATALLLNHIIINIELPESDPTPTTPPAKRRPREARATKHRGQLILRPRFLFLLLRVLPWTAVMTVQVGVLCSVLLLLLALLTLQLPFSFLLLLLILLPVALVLLLVPFLLLGIPI
jgi:hypothetical protein